MSGEDSKLPPSVRQFLTVASADGESSRPGPVAPSPFLAALSDFLPKMQAANAALPPKDARNDDSSIEIIAQVAPAATGVVDVLPKAEEDGNGAGSHSEEEENNEGVPTVHMDLYVDGALGELVSQQEEDGEEKGSVGHGRDEASAGKPLVEVVEHAA